MIRADYAIDGEIESGAAQLLTAFLDANPGPLTIALNSYGGVAVEGAAIMAAMERHGQVTVRIDGIAASAASLAAMGAARITMHPQALLMLHEPSAFAFGTADSMRHTASTLDKMTTVYGAGYARATGNPEKWVLDWMKAETWLSASEAVELNFADEVEKTDQSAIVAAFDYGRFRNAPARLVALAKEKGWATMPGVKERKTDA